MAMRILVTGARGQLGTELLDAFPGHEVVGTTVDVGDRDAVHGAAFDVRPDRIVHAGAWTDVDGCEGDPDRAFRSNGVGTRNVVEAARRVDAHVLYVSSDYVFPGDAMRPYTEWDTPGPLSVYGWSKLAGERELAPSDCIVRTSWVCGRHGRNFVRTMLTRALTNEKTTVVDDQVGCPTMADDLARTIARLAVDARPGIFHVTNQGAVSWFEFAREVFALAGADPALVEAISTAELDPPRPAPRPQFSVLDNTVLRLSDLPLLPDFRASLLRLVEALS
jgi:dTDP-4-dehydrorhamnose reductase